MGSPAPAPVMVPAPQPVALPGLEEFQPSGVILSHLAWLERTGEVHNLTRVPREDWMSRHVLDSLAPHWAGLEMGKRFLDMGTGPGFPGVPLAVAFPEVKATLVESKEKVVRELESFLKAENLASRVQALAVRLEDLAKDPDHREGYDRVVTRALASLSVLIELGVPFLRPGGRLWCWKSDLAEIEPAAAALGELNASLVRVFSYHLPGEDKSRYLLEIERSGRLPEKYPRRAGIPQKRPL